MRKKVFLAAVICAFHAAIAEDGYLAQNVEVLAVGNTSGNGDSFYITVSAASGGTIDADCVPLGYIEFNRSHALNDQYLARAYATALAAMTAGMKVDVFRYAGGPSTTAHCKEAQSITMKR